MSLDGGLGAHKNEADLILLVAARVPWYPPADGPAKAKVIRICDNLLKGQVVYQNLQVDFYLEGDLASSLELLLKAVRAKDVDVAEVKKRRVKWRAEHDKQTAAKRDTVAKLENTSPINPISLIGALNDARPRGAIVVDETVRHGGLVKQYLNLDRPQSYFRASGGLGQGMGLALGCKLADRTRPVVLVIGDGSFLYNSVLTAFGTSKNRDLPILVVVFNNKAYEAMRTHHKRYYPEGVAARSNTYLGVNIDGPDYAELGAPFGFSGGLVRQPFELAPALKRRSRPSQTGKPSS